jgi:hypothetical protein
LRQVVDRWRIRGRYLRVVDGVCRAIFDQEGEEGEDAVDEEGHDEGVNEKEDGETATHVCGV